MPQVSLYLNDQALSCLRAEAKKEKRSLSSFVSELIAERAEKSAWPKGYWDEVYGCLKDGSFQIPAELDEAADGPLPLLRMNQAIAMRYLDSDICINLMRGALPAFYECLRESDPSSFAIPAVVEAELRTGAAKSDDPKGNLRLLERFMAPFARIPFDSNCAIAYGNIRAYLEQSGKKIGPNDLLIAATAQANNAVLVTGNTREFSRIPTLSIENWAEVEG